MVPPHSSLFRVPTFSKKARRKWANEQARSGKESEIKQDHSAAYDADLPNNSEAPSPEVSRLSDCLEVRFQPVVHVYGGQCYALEAEFRFPALQALGLEQLPLAQLDAEQRRALLTLVLERTFDQFASLGASHSVRLVVAVPLAWIAKGELSPSELTHSLEKYLLTPRQLCLLLHIDEMNRHQPKEMLKPFRKQGVRLVFQDAQKQLEGWRWVLELEPEYVKITSDLFHGQETDHKRRTFVANLLNLAHLSGSRIIATRIRGQEELVPFRELGGYLVQGDWVFPPEADTNRLRFHYPHVAEASPQRNASRHPTSLQQEMDYIEPIHSRRDVFEVFERFWRNKNTTFVPIVNEDSEPLGIIRDMDLKEFAYSMYGRELLRNPRIGKNLFSFLKRVPVLDVNTSPQTVLELFSLNEDSIECVLLTEHNRYVGVFTPLALLRMMSHRQEAGSAPERSHQPSLIQGYLSKTLELQTAAAIQQTLLPRQLPQHPRVSIASHYQSATETGGDWYGFMTEFPDKLIFLIGDVTGHGTPSALVTASACATCRALESIFAPRQMLGPGEILERLNLAIFESGNQEYLMTFFVAVLDLPSGKLDFANAGHNFPILRTAEGQIRKLLNSNPVLGFQRDQTYQSSSTQLNEGEVLLFFTDGVIECESPEGRMFGERQLLKGLRKPGSIYPNTFIDQVIQDVEQFTDNAPLEDDMTLVCCRFNP